MGYVYSNMFFISSSVVVVVAGNQASITRDKFLVMYMEVEADTSNSYVTELFKTSAKDAYAEHRCVQLEPLIVRFCTCILNYITNFNLRFYDNSKKT